MSRFASSSHWWGRTDSRGSLLPTSANTSKPCWQAPGDQVVLGGGRQVGCATGHLHAAEFQLVGPVEELFGAALPPRRLEQCAAGASLDLVRLQQLDLGCDGAVHVGGAESELPDIYERSMSPQPRVHALHGGALVDDVGYSGASGLGRSGCGLEEPGRLGGGHLCDLGAASHRGAPQLQSTRQFRGGQSDAGHQCPTRGGTHRGQCRRSTAHPVAIPGRGGVQQSMRGLDALAGCGPSQEGAAQRVVRATEAKSLRARRWLGLTAQTSRIPASTSSPLGVSPLPRP